MGDSYVEARPWMKRDAAPQSLGRSFTECVRLRCERRRGQVERRAWAPQRYLHGATREYGS